jgi:hypothetical protein
MDQGLRMLRPATETSKDQPARRWKVGINGHVNGSEIGK